MDENIWDNDDMAESHKEKKKFGYARVSTTKQRNDRQIDEIKRVCPEATIITETYSGATMDRPKWNRLLSLARQGKVNVIYMDELSRMGRDRDDGFRQWMELYNLGVELKFIKTPQADTAVYKESLSSCISLNVNTNDKATDILINSIISSLNTYMEELAKRQIKIMFDEAASEREFLSKRTKEGLHVAAINGKQIGRASGTKITTKKKKTAQNSIRKHYKGFGGALTATQCMKITGISKQTFYTYLKEMQMEKEENG